MVAILKTEEPNFLNNSYVNSSLHVYDYENNCGINFCPTTELAASQSKPTTESFIVLYICLVGLCLLAILVTFFFVDDIAEEEQHVEKQEKLSICKFHELLRLYSEIISSTMIYNIFKHLK